MSDAAVRDRDHIDLDDDYQVSEWLLELGVNEQQLRAAVDTVGNSATSVREHLASRVSG
jgi:hypothetical protein